MTQKILLLINLGGGGYNPRNPPFAYGPVNELRLKHFDWLRLRLMDQSQDILLGHAIFASSEYRMTSYRCIARLISNKWQYLVQFLWYFHEITILVNISIHGPTVAFPRFWHNITSSFISVKTERLTTTICHAGQRLFTCSYAYAATQDSHN